MKHLIDLILSLILLILLTIPMILVAITIRFSSKGPVLYWSDRVGKNGEMFRMPKFRSMRVEAPQIPTHLLNDSNDFLYPFGSFIRRYSIDEFPQLYSILKRDMSFVGPRPALFNQGDLISLRKANGVIRLLPGLTGLAQINGRDNLSIYEKVALDLEYMKKQSVLLDLKILFKTLIKVVKSDGVSH
jgi:O-antigen biosynthesis protein WbqP